jgi:hypothetical protein
MTTDQIVLELRSLPGAPDRLRERVRTLPEPQRRTWTLPRLEVKRTLLVVAPAVVVLGLGGAAVSGLLSGARSPRTQELAARTVDHGAAAVGGARKAKGGQPFQAATIPSTAVPSTLDQLRAQPLPASPTRLNRYQAWLSVRVDRDRLAAAARSAMGIARAYGGYVASVDMNTPGTRGRALLVLRVPVTRVEDAVLRLGRLGDVTAQHVRIQDLQRKANQEENQLVKLRASIVKLEEELKNPSLPADQRFRLQLQLQQARRSLGQKTRLHQGTIREGTLATVSVTFATPVAAAAKPHHPGRLERSARDAGSFLVKELAWLLYALIVVAPIALLAAAAVVSGRAGRRRLDRKLLEQA